jgi:hypothetical protein
LDSLLRPRFMQEVAVAEQLLQPQQFHRSPIADVTPRKGGMVRYVSTQLRDIA